MLSSLISGAIVGVTLAIAGVNVIDEPYKFFVLAALIYVAGYFQFGV